MNFNQRIRGAFDTVGVTKAAQQAADESGLACAEIAFEVNHQAGNKHGPQGSAQGERGGFVCQFKGHGAIIACMHEEEEWRPLAAQIKIWGRELGFSAVGIAGVDLGDAEAGLKAWTDAGFHGEMDYMAAHGSKRARPDELIPGTRSVIAVRMDYLPQAADAALTLGEPRRAYISRYALGRDYHKVLRNRLQKLAERIAETTKDLAFRGFTDSAPVLEVELARRAGLGWRGKHTLLLSREAGSWYFLGELFTNLPLPPDTPSSDHCGDCTACISACPTGAIVAPYRVDARRCISYLTIELKTAIPAELRPLIGNRVYGCDDCQLGCPWNRFAQATREEDFAVRNGLDSASLVDLFAWGEDEFDSRLSGSAIRRIGHERWLRNLAVGLGNAPSSPEVIAALRSREQHPSDLVKEHVAWALKRHMA